MQLWPSAIPRAFDFLIFFQNQVAFSVYKMGRGRRGSNKRGNYRNQGSRNKSNRGSGNKHKRGFNKGGDSNKDDSSESKRQKLELEKEKQPVVEEESSSSESEEEVKPYIQLLSMFKSSSKAQQVLTSDEEEQSEEEIEEEQFKEDDIESEGESGSVSDIDDEETEEEEVENSLEEEAEEEESDCEEEQSKLEQEDSEESEEELLEDEPLSSTDPFSLHYERELSENLLEILTSAKPYETQELKWKVLGRMVVHLPRKIESKIEKPKPILEDSVEKFVIPGTLPVLKTGIPMKDYGIKLQLCTNLDRRPLSDNNDTQTAEELLSPLQHELFTLANDYRDVYYPEMNHSNNDEIRTVYCLHSLNHILKSRDRVLHHNAKLKKASESGAMTGEIEYRDQGLVRPRVLIIAPLRNSAVK